MFIPGSFVYNRILEGDKNMIKKNKYSEIEAIEMLEGVTMRVVIGPDQGAPHCVL